MTPRFDIQYRNHNLTSMANPAYTGHKLEKRSQPSEAAFRRRDQLQLS